MHGLVVERGVIDLARGASVIGAAGHLLDA